jgi:hypothetical protein
MAAESVEDSGGRRPAAGQRGQHRSRVPVDEGSPPMVTAVLDRARLVDRSLVWGSVKKGGWRREGACDGA